MAICYKCGETMTATQKWKRDKRGFFHASCLIQKMNPKTNTLKSEGARVLLHKSAQWYVKELGRKNGSWGSLENAVSRLESAAIQFAESGAKPIGNFKPDVIMHDKRAIVNEVLKAGDNTNMTTL